MKKQFIMSEKEIKKLSHFVKRVQSEHTRDIKQNRTTLFEDNELEEVMKILEV